MIYKPKDYQKEAVKFLLKNPAAALFVDPGLGKTSIVLKTLEILRKNNKIKKALIVAPLLVCYNVWPQEIKKWEFDFKAKILHGKKKQKNADIYLINPEILEWFFDNVKTIPKDTALIIDESTRFKNPSGKRLKVLKKYLVKFKRRIILTGTPMPNMLQDLWSQIYILDLGKALGAKSTYFSQRYLYLKNPKNWVYAPRPGAQKRVEKRIGHLVFRADADKHLDLPPILYNHIKLDMPTALQEKYNKFEKTFFVELDDNLNASESILAGSAGHTYQVCRQWANGAVYRDREELKGAYRELHQLKLDALENLCNELCGKPLLIAYWYKHDGHRIHQRLIGPYDWMLEPRSKATDAIDMWNAGKLRTLAIHPGSAAHGLNLQAGGNDLVFFSLLDNLEYYQQLIRRLYRQGVKGQVRIHHIVMRKTVDIAIMNRLKNKSQKQSALLNALLKYRRKKWNT
jgi:hypothetical protein